MLTCWKMEYVCITCFFLIYTQNLLNPPLCRFREGSVNIFIYNMCFFSANNLAHAQTLYRMRSLCRSSDHIHEYMNIMRVNIECFTGCKRIKQRRISFVPGYLRMILWKISTAISIKHRILATFNIKKNNSDSLYAFKWGTFGVI